MYRIYFIVVFVSLSFCKSVDSYKAPGLSFQQLKCDAMENPIGIDKKQPLFSWVMSADGFNRAQSAYQILVASSISLLTPDQADVWNSGKLLSAQSAHVEYGGKDLVATTKYYWKVRIWDEAGEASDWSPTNTFETGIIDDANWLEGKWLSVKEDTRTSDYRFRAYQTGNMEKPAMVTSQPVGYFRNVLTIDKELSEARAYICGLGYYELSMNGAKIGDHVLDPAPSNYDKQAYYVAYDITSDIHKGENAIGVELGNGFYGQNISWKRDPESERDLSYGPPAFQLQIKLTYQDGSSETIYSNENWKVTTGPTVFDNIYGGDTYDARFEINGWNDLGYDDSAWSQPLVVDPKLKKISHQNIPPIRELKRLSPQRVFQSPDGEWIVDFGQNIAGWVEIKVQEEKGQLINMIMTEALLTNGKDIFLGSTGGGANGMKQNLQYICKGEGLETWSPKFSYYGFRYCKITGISRKPDAGMIQAVLVATDLEETGSFTSSDSLLNKMHSISKWTIVDNMHGIPEDCPHREKCGWLGDAHAFGEYALYNYEMGNFYKKYMEDISTQMRPVKGKFNPEETYRAPTMIAPGRRTSTIAKIDWGVATMYLPWYSYKYNGDSSIVRDYYDDMKVLTEYYLSFKGENGIMQDGMGDWCPPLWDRRKNPSAMECDPIISANAYFYDVLGVMQHFAKMTGDTAYESKMEREKNDLLKAFNNEYLVTIDNTDHSWYGSQTATVMALQFGMVPEESLSEVLNGLEYDIVEVKGGHHSTGIHGNRYIYTVLTKYGKGDLAYDILTTPDFPSQTYVMNSGFTTWPERQFEWEKMEGPTNSLNHPMHSGFSAYFFESLGGIKSTYEEAGYKSFTVDPVFPSAISSTTVEVPTPYGKIKNAWNNEGEHFTMKLSVPFNTSALIKVSKEQRETMNINGRPWTEVKDDGLVSVLDQNTLKIGSGNYELTYRTK
ncbi:MAG: family 78 glycoside hydrolase catalytic domain [Cyclobacteriaceae bacterium]